MTIEPLSHDRIARLALSIPEVVRQFLAAWLPAEFLALVDWSALRVEPITGINESLAERREDVVYRVEVAGRPVHFYILIEHQSEPDSKMPLRVLEYEVLAWQEDRRRERGSPRHWLPLIIPVVLYPGPGRWSGVRRLRELIAIPESIVPWADSFAPDCGFCVVELAGVPFERLAEGPVARAVLAALQGARVGEMDFAAVQAIVAELFCDEKQRAVAVQLASHLWTYLLHHSKLQPGEIDRIVDSTVPTDQKGRFMSTAELLREEGLKQGIEQGIEQGVEQGVERGRQEGEILARQRDLIDVLEVRFGRVPDATRAAIGGVSDSEKLRSLLRAAIGIPDLPSFDRELR